jgi:O-antigen ligase
MISSGTFYQQGKGLTLNYYLNAYGFPFSIFFLAKNVVENEDEIKKIFIFFAMIGLYLGLTGIFEHFDIKQLVYPSDIMNPFKGVSWGRARGPFMNSAVNGTAIGMIIFILIYLLLHEKLVWRKIFFFSTLLCMLATLLFTLTRGCWIAFLVAAITSSIFISQVRKVFVPGLIVVISIIIFILATSDISFRSNYTETELQWDEEVSLKEKLFYRFQKVETIVGRLDLYKISFKMFLKKPLLGYGYGVFVEAKKKFISQSNENISDDKFITHITRGHDTLVGILVDLGLVGFSFLIFIVFRIFSTCKKLYSGRNRIESKFIPKYSPVLFSCIFIVYLINIQTIDVRIFLFPNGLFFLLAGIIVGIDQRSERDGFEREHAAIG